MDGNGLSSDEVTANLIEMGFQNSAVLEAIKAVGPSFDDALDYLSNYSRRNSRGASSSSRCSTRNEKALGKRTLSSLPPSGQLRQSNLLDHFQSAARSKRSRIGFLPDVLVSGSNISPGPVEEHKEDLSGMSDPFPVDCPQELDIASDWEKKVTSLLQKHFGYSSLKNFQKEALAAWLAHQDCLVLAATGSGKSLCFQIPAMLTGKVVVVISPLISLMHDQCLKLAQHGVTSCFLGSGQPDSTVEQKAMRGMYSIVYVCPETLLRLIKPLQRLAEGRGIALFAIDEVHCVSKWGHDFRPDYRRLSVLRENFSACNLKFLKYDVPLMALTATATIRVKHSRTSSSSYAEDFCELIDKYVRKRKTGDKKQTIISEELDDTSCGSDNCSISEANDLNDIEDSYTDGDVDESVDDWDVAFGEFYGQSPSEDWNMSGLSETIDPLDKPEERLRLLHEPLGEGPTIIYVVVATIAFGMGIDKSNVRRIIHYGWPQSLEAYYQEAGRAGRDGKLADCTLYANLTRVPSLLPSKRSADQTKQAYRMLSDIFRYGMSTSCCRAKTLVEYFGEDFSYDACLLCDMCTDGPPQMQNLKEEAEILVRVVAAYCGSTLLDGSYDERCTDIKQRRSMEMPNLRMCVSKIREQFQKFVTTDLLWWQGLARILEVKGYIREADDKGKFKTFMYFTDAP
uniref:DNA 3'-5' helicase n=1 Tax=Fagus sylvatica TaxID=28930 RepID=A0A2N9J9E4_FAGSY